VAYALLKEPLSHRALEDARQTELIRPTWSESGNVYGYRKLTDDLRDHGETCSETRDAARQDLFDYIVMFYNPKRKHTNNGMLSPVDFETRQQKLNEAGV
jgi:putative transposase